MEEKLDKIYSLFESEEEVKEFIRMINEKASDPKAEVITDDNIKAEEIDVPNDYKHCTNIFKNIIVFTNNTNPKDNKTLNTIVEAVENLKKSEEHLVIPNVYAFDAEEVSYNENQENNTLTIFDKDTTLEINDDINNSNTIIFSRLGVRGQYDCEHIVELLQSYGLPVFNPNKYSAIASDKYETAVLLEKGGIPQPKFCLMNKDILYDEKRYNESMKSIYTEWDSKDTDKNAELQFVVKILDGHGGTGVSLLDGKRIYAVLQTMFAVKPDLDLIIQKKEEADGGDIRVHVLTLRNKQKILCAMKRVKIKGDFRSNVSLGATAEPVELTEEQRQIALKTAQISKLPWCAVDIMPLVKGSNPKTDNVVLEINASPGTEGISDVIEYNFINLLLNELDDPKEFYLQKKQAGFKEYVHIKFDNEDDPVQLLATLDTGNGSKASHVEVGEIKWNKDKKKVSFTYNNKKYDADVINVSNTHVGDGVSERPIIKINELRIGRRILNNVEIALVEKRERSTSMLINREVMSEMGYVIDPDNTFVLAPEKEKTTII